MKEQRQSLLQTCKAVIRKAQRHNRSDGGDAPHAVIWEMRIIIIKDLLGFNLIVDKYYWLKRERLYTRISSFVLDVQNLNQIQILPLFQFHLSFFFSSSENVNSNIIYLLFSGEFPFLLPGRWHICASDLTYLS